MKNFYDSKSPYCCDGDQNHHQPRETSKIPTTLHMVLKFFVFNWERKKLNRNKNDKKKIKIK